MIMRNRRLLNILLLFLLICLIHFCSGNSRFSKGGIYYSVNSDGVSVTVTHRSISYNSYTDSVVVPREVYYYGKKYMVTGIGKYAFAYCEHLQSVEIPEGVIAIGDMAFYGSAELTKVVCRAKTVPEIGVSVFGEDIQQQAVLYVPAPLVALYKGKEGWENFRKIDSVRKQQ